MNLYDAFKTYRRTVTKKSDGSALFRLELERVRSDRIRVLTHITAENRTTAFTKVRLGIKRTELDHYLDELQTVAANELAVSDKLTILEELDQFFAEFTGTTSGDVLVLTAIGWEVKI